MEFREGAFDFQTSQQNPSLDRLGRDYEDIKNTVAFMKQKKVALKILDAQ
ncbi:recombinase, partial [Enterococcus faecium]